MSSTSPVSNSSTAASATRAQAHPGRNAAAPGQGSDLFSSLLALLSATHDTQALDAELGQDASEAKDPGLPQLNNTPEANPLAALLGWASAAPQPLTLPPDLDPIPKATSAMGGAGLATDRLGMALISTSDALPTAPSMAPGLTLEGMTLLDTPAAPDARTLAALGQTTSNTAPTGTIPTGNTAVSTPSVGTTASNTPTPTGLTGPTAPGKESVSPAGGDKALPPVWRSTVGQIAGTNTPALVGATSSGNDKAQLSHPAWVAQSRSTVALDERFNLARAEAGESSQSALGESAPAGQPTGTQAQGGGSDSAGSPPEHGALDMVPERKDNLNVDSVTVDTTRGADEVTEPQWPMAELRHASLRVGEAGEDAINVQLALNGQELNVEFRTDNSEARANLAQDAGKSLGELLERSGIQLGEVSVGAQSQHQGTPNRSPEPMPSQPRGRSAARDQEAPAIAPVVQPPRRDGSRPLDLFV